MHNTVIHESLLLSFIIWIVIGAIIGWLAGLVVQGGFGFCRGCADRHPWFGPRRISVSTPRHFAGRRSGRVDPVFRYRRRDRCRGGSLVAKAIDGLAVKGPGLAL